VQQQALLQRSNKHFYSDITSTSTAQQLYHFYSGITSTSTVQQQVFIHCSIKHIYSPAASIAADTSDLLKGKTACTITAQQNKQCYKHKCSVEGQDSMYHYSSAKQSKASAL